MTNRKILEDEIEALNSEVDNLIEENTLLKQLLSAYLSYEDKQYLKIKYDLDF